MGPSALDAPELLVPIDPLRRTFAFTKGEEVSFEKYLQDAGLVLDCIGMESRLLLECRDRYNFAVALMATIVDSKSLVLPPDQGRMTRREIESANPGLKAIQDVDLEKWLSRSGPPRLSRTSAHVIEEMRSSNKIAVVTYTSGTSGVPKPYQKTPVTLSQSAALIDYFLGGVSGVRIVATVPPQHMYGLETSVLLPLYRGGVLDGRWPFFPADIVSALEDGPGPVSLITTPFHLSALLRDHSLTMPPVRFVVSATAPLGRDLAIEAERRFSAPLLEIYGCTELGSIAGRRPSVSEEWAWFDGVSGSQQGDRTLISARHVPDVISEADLIQRCADGRFILRGRQSDLVNVAGKRTSLGYLERQALRVEGILDIVFLQHPCSQNGVERLGAIVTTSSRLSVSAIRALLGEALDPVFVPRTILIADRIPRDRIGKISRKDLIDMLWKKADADGETDRS